MREGATACSAALRADTDGTRKPRLLFVLPIVPWPIRRNGISLRFAPVIDYLAQRYELAVLVLAEEDEPLPSSSSLQQQRIELALLEVPITSLPRWLRRIKTMCYVLSPWSPPLSSLRYDRRRLERALLGYLDGKNYSVVIWAARYLEVACRIRRRFTQTRFVIDVVDSPALFSFRSAPANRLERMLVRYDGWKWRRQEQQAREAFDATIYISNVDAPVGQAGRTARVHVVPNGIFHADAPPLATADASGRTIGFLGNMDYPPNISAALRLAQRIFPRILTTLADATLLIIGRDPAPAISQLAGPRISVTGTVDNIWPHITRANVFVFPMIEGTGLQNKILEAMYAGVPVVTTSIAANAMEARSGEQLLVGDSDEEIVAQVVKLLGDRQYGTELAGRARAFVLRHFSWPTILPRYEAIVAPRNTSQLAK
jgi:glycosyltransferase involved in cell wall biosynthesis